VTPIQRRRLFARRVGLTAAIAAGLAVASIGVAHRGDSIIPPDRRLDDLTDQLAPMIREFNAIRKELSRSVGRGEEEAVHSEQQAGLSALRGLRARAVINAARLEGVRTSNPELRAIRESLSRALAGQVARIDALSRYAETGDAAALDAARDALATTIEATRECEEHRLRYATRHGLIFRGPSRHPDRG
jgi:hypothetical protein